MIPHPPLTHYYLGYSFILFWPVCRTLWNLFPGHKFPFCLRPFPSPSMLFLRKFSFIWGLIVRLKDSRVFLCTVIFFNFEIIIQIHYFPCSPTPPMQLLYSPSNLWHFSLFLPICIFINIRGHHIQCYLYVYDFKQISLEADYFSS